MYKSLLSAEELNALLAQDPLSEPASQEPPAGAAASLVSEEARKRIERLELEIVRLLQRVEWLESRLSGVEPGAVRELQASQEAAAAAAPISPPPAVPAGKPEETPSAPISLSRVEKYKHQQKPKKSLFR